MYNEQLKLAFIDKYTDKEKTAKLVQHLFNGTEEIEKRYNLDFYAMNREQAQEAFNYASGTKVNGAGALLKILQAYVRWCKANGYPVTDAISEVQIDVSDKIRDSYVMSPLHLKQSLDEAFPHPEENEIEYVYRSFLWLAFMGLQSSEAIKVTDTDLDFSESRLSYGGRIHPIYFESILDLKKAVTLKEFKEPRGKNGVRKQRAVGHEILRGKVTQKTLEEAVEQTFRPTISRAFRTAFDKYVKECKVVPSHLSLKLTYKHVYMSGIFYRMRDRERIGFRPNFDEIVMIERRNSKESNFSRNYTERKLLNILIRDMEKDYENWKRAFP